MAPAVRRISRSGPVRSMNRRRSPGFTPPMSAELMTGGKVSTSPFASASSGNRGKPATMGPYSLPFGCSARISRIDSGRSKSSGVNRTASGSAARKCTGHVMRSARDTPMAMVLRLRPKLTQSFSCDWMISRSSASVTSRPSATNETMYGRMSARPASTTTRRSADGFASPCREKKGYEGIGRPRYTLSCRARPRVDHRSGRLVSFSSMRSTFALVVPPVQLGLGRGQELHERRLPRTGGRAPGRTALR